MVIATVMVIVMATVMVMMLLMTMLLFYGNDLYMVEGGNSKFYPAHTPLPRDGAGGRHRAHEQNGVHISMFIHIQQTARRLNSILFSPTEGQSLGRRGIRRCTANRTTPIFMVWSRCWGRPHV